MHLVAGEADRPHAAPQRPGQPGPQLPLRTPAPRPGATRRDPGAPCRAAAPPRAVPVHPRGCVAPMRHGRSCSGRMNGDVAAQISHPRAAPLDRRAGQRRPFARGRARGDEGQRLEPRTSPSTPSRRRCASTCACRPTPTRRRSSRGRCPARTSTRRRRSIDVDGHTVRDRRRPCASRASSSSPACSPASECEQLIAQARTRLARSETVETRTGKSEINTARTSDGMFFEPAEFEICARVEARIAALAALAARERRGPAGAALRTRHRIQAALRLLRSRPSRARRRSSSAAASGSARSSATSTRPSEGGATVFPDVGLDVAPRSGQRGLLQLRPAAPGDALAARRRAGQRAARSGSRRSGCASAASSSGAPRLGVVRRRGVAERPAALDPALLALLPGLRRADLPALDAAGEVLARRRRKAARRAPGQAQPPGQARRAPRRPSGRSCARARTPGARS